MSGERGTSGRGGFASELFRKRPGEESSPISSLTALMEAKPPLADGSTVWAGTSRPLPAEVGARTRTAKAQRLPRTGQGKNSGVFRHGQGKLKEDALQGRPELHGVKMLRGGGDLTQPKEGCRSGGPSVVEVPAKEMAKVSVPEGALVGA